MLCVKHVHRLLVLCRIRRAIRLVFVQRLLHLFREPIAQAIARLDPQLHRRRAIGDDEAVQSLGLVDGMARAEHAAPRVADDIVVRDLEMQEEVVELVEKQLRRPERGVEPLFGEVRREAGTQLIVQDDGNVVLGGHVLHGEHVVMAHAGAAVKADQGSSAGFEVAKDLVPRLAWLPSIGDGEVGLAFGGSGEQHAGWKELAGGKVEAARSEQVSEAMVTTSTRSGYSLLARLRTYERSAWTKKVGRSESLGEGRSWRLRSSQMVKVPQSRRRSTL